MPTKRGIEYLDIVLPVILKLINGSLESGVVPKCFKAAVIKPLLKKSNLDPNSMKNYRPVSNLPFISKLLERVVTEQLVIHQNENRLLDKFQSAYFRIRLSLVTIIGTSCREHRQVSLLAEQLPVASLILFLRRREHGPLCLTSRKRCVQRASEDA